MIKRACDILVSAIGTALMLPLFSIVAMCIKFDSCGPVFFKQWRVGQFGRPFRIYKFRTMSENAQSGGKHITVNHDPRITRIGKILRRWKIDELPQLINVLKGDMSLVGPRPEVRKYVNFYQADYDEILRIRPGITDMASLKYRNESDLLNRHDEAESAYVREILPDKIRLAKEYMGHSSVIMDLKVIISTVFRYDLFS